MTAKEHHQAQEVRNLLLKLYYKTTMTINFKIRKDFAWVW